MSALHDYLNEHAARGVFASLDRQADVVFFGVTAKPSATAEGLRAAIAGHKGEFCEANPFDGKEHSYIELGGWIGDQGLALKFIGLGAVLGMWRLLTPRTLFGGLIDDATAQRLAGSGLVALQAEAA